LTICFRRIIRLYLRKENWCKSK